MDKHDFANNMKSDWNNLYRIGGVAALVIVGLVPIQIIILVISPPPTTVMGFFSLFQQKLST